MFIPRSVAAATLVAVATSVLVPAANAGPVTVPAGSTWRVWAEYTGGCASIQHIGPSAGAAQSGCSADGYAVDEWHVTVMSGTTFGARVSSRGANVVHCGISEGEGVPPIVYQGSQSGETVTCLVTAK